MDRKILSTFLIIILCLSVCLMGAESLTFSWAEESPLDTETGEEEIFNAGIFHWPPLLPSDSLVAADLARNAGPFIDPLVRPPKIFA